ncbi:MAG: hypothetical protein HXY23_14075 [Parvularculaceae bacterium]|nr:hypothetical protein [Parvularculaceae bacterium]
MSAKKKEIRAEFRRAVFERDNHKCVICGHNICSKGIYTHLATEDVLDAHHITPREKMPNGGYVKENGISLCKEKCHLLAEEYLQGTNTNEEYSPKSLYARIGSSFEQALIASKC